MKSCLPGAGREPDVEALAAKHPGLAGQIRDLVRARDAGSAVTACFLVRPANY